MNQILPFIMKYKIAIAILVFGLLYYFLVYKKKSDKEEENPNKAAMEKEIASVIDRIKNDSGWFDMIKDKAVANGLTVEQELRGNAIWILQQPNESKGGFDYSNYK